MSREIKFRGLRKDTSEWVYGNICKDIGGGYCICPMTFFSSYIFKDEDEMIYDLKIDGRSLGGFFSVVPESVGEYTGLKDKNGKEIYEGDILYNTEYGHKFKIQWGIEGESYAGWAGNWLDRDFITPLFNGPLHNCEIIGNIHENPDLLK